VKNGGKIMIMKISEKVRVNRRGEVCAKSGNNERSVGMSRAFGECAGRPCGMSRAFERVG
jgi:hypothetical protein